MDHIESHQVDFVSNTKLVAEASSLRWAPGYVPRRLSTTLGNGLDFIQVDCTEFLFKYEQANGSLELIVFND